MQDGEGIECTGHEENEDRNAAIRQRDSEEGLQRFTEQRSRNGKGGGGSSEKRKYSKKVNESPREAIRVAAKQRAAGLRVLLPCPFPHVEHEAEGDGQYEVEAPWNRTPVEERKGTGPVHATAELGGMRILPVEYPFTERVKENIGGETCREHHGAPLEEAVSRLLVRCTEHDAPITGQGNVEGENSGAQSDDEVVEPEAVAEEGANSGKDGIGFRRQQEEQQCQHDNECKRHQRDHPVNALPIRYRNGSCVCFILLHVHFLLTN